MHDPIIQTKICPISGTPFDITQGDMDFYEKISPILGGKKYHIPTPTLCPAERQRRRLAFRNERTLYKRTCDASGKQIISMYKPSTPLDKGGQGGFVIYDQKIRRSDSWDAMDHGRTFDFGRTFTEQFGELMRDVPKMGIMNDDNVTSTNCTYTNDFLYGKNCYMCDSMGECEDCYYTHHSNGAKDVIDCNNAHKCINCYEVSDSINSYQCTHSFGLYKSQNCYWSSFLTGCDHCIFCSGLNNQSYCYMNEKVSREEFEKIIEKVKLDREWLETQNTKYIINILDREKFDNIRNSTNCVGKNIIDSNNLYQCYNATNSENSKYSFILYDTKNSMDITCRKSELCLEGQILDESFKSGFCDCVTRSNNTFYSQCCYDVSNIFGCVGLRNASYCIFNKQYTKEEYEALVPQIIEHMINTKERGEFFHPSLSPFGYNETVVMDYYPMEREGEVGRVGEVSHNFPNSLTISHFSSFGYHRSTYTPPTPVSDKVIQGADLPSTIDAVQDDILQYAIACEVTGKLFRLQPKELAFYRKHNIPVPRRHPDQRHADRLAMRKG